MVWLQANKFLVPRIAFINKMDRPGASLDFTIKSIQNKLNVTTLVLQMPLGESEHFRGVIDLLKLESIEWNDSLGIYVTTTPVTQTHKNYAEIMKNRDKLLENLAMVDDSFAVK